MMSDVRNCLEAADWQLPLQSFGLLFSPARKATAGLYTPRSPVTQTGDSELQQTHAQTPHGIRSCASTDCRRHRAHAYRSRLRPARARWPCHRARPPHVEHDAVPHRMRPAPLRRRRPRCRRRRPLGLRSPRSPLRPCSSTPRAVPRGFLRLGALPGGSPTRFPAPTAPAKPVGRWLCLPKVLTCSAWRLAVRQPFARRLHAPAEGESLTSPSRCTGNGPTAAKPCTDLLASRLTFHARGQKGRAPRERVLARLEGDVGRDSSSWTTHDGPDAPRATHPTGGSPWRPSGFEVIEETDCRRNTVVKYVASKGQGTGDAMRDLSRARRYLNREINRLRLEREDSHPAGA